jgi:hypothetical protein
MLDPDPDPHLINADPKPWKSLYKMAAPLKGKRTPITTPPYQAPSVDITPDPPIFSLVTTFKMPKMIKTKEYSAYFSVKMCHSQIQNPDPATNTDPHP